MVVIMCFKGELSFSAYFCTLGWMNRSGEVPQKDAVLRVPVILHVQDGELHHKNGVLLNGEILSVVNSRVSHHLKGASINHVI